MEKQQHYCKTDNRGWPQGDRSVTLHISITKTQNFTTILHTYRAHALGTSKKARYISLWNPSLFWRRNVSTVHEVHSHWFKWSVHTQTQTRHNFTRSITWWEYSVDNRKIGVGVHKKLIRNLDLMDHPVCRSHSLKLTLSLIKSIITTQNKEASTLADSKQTRPDTPVDHQHS